MGSTYKPTYYYYFFTIYEYYFSYLLIKAYMGAQKDMI